MLKNQTKLFYSTKPGTSLLVALGLTTIIVLVSLGVTTVVVSSIRESANVTGANQAYYAAEGALEEGLLFNQQQGAGYTTTTPTTVSTKIPQSNYAIAGQVSPDLKYKGSSGFSGYYGIPAPGTGNVAADCDSLNPDISDQFWFDITNSKIVYTQPVTNYVGPYSPEDNPCNWSKLNVGETVSIPLYVTNNDPANNCGAVCNPVDLGLNSIKIRVRMPCTSGQEFCDKNGRYTLYYALSPLKSYIATNDTIMNWQIDAQNMGGDKSYTLDPYIVNNTISPGCFDILNYSGVGIRCGSLGDSEIYEALMNVGGPNHDDVVLAIDANDPNNAGAVDQTNTPVYATDYLTNANFATTADDINKPVLKLSVIHSLQDSPSTNIPYLEYQVLTDSTTYPPTDTSQTIKAEGFSGTFKQVLEVKNPQQSGILQYVIQQ